MMKREKKVNKVHYRKFMPLDRDSPIFEILFEEQIIMDVSQNEDTGKFEIMFHKDIAYTYMDADSLLEIIETGKSLISEGKDDIA